MNQKDKKKVIAILKTADGGCEICVKKLLNQFKKEFGK